MYKQYLTRRLIALVTYLLLCKSLAYVGFIHYSRWLSTATIENSCVCEYLSCKMANNLICINNIGQGG